MFVYRSCISFIQSFAAMLFYPVIAVVVVSDVSDATLLPGGMVDDAGQSTRRLVLGYFLFCQSCCCVLGVLQHAAYAMRTIIRC